MCQNRSRAISLITTMPCEPPCKDYRGSHVNILVTKTCVEIYAQPLFWESENITVCMHSSWECFPNVKFIQGFNYQTKLKNLQSQQRHGEKHKDTD